MKRQFIIGFLIGIIFISFAWRWYSENVKNCYYAKGVTDYVKSMGTTTAREIIIFWRPTGGDYKACQLVGEDL